MASFGLMTLNAKAATTEVITPVNQQGWTSEQPAADTRPGGAVEFSKDFGAPAGLGSAALKISTTDGAAKAQMVKPLDGTLDLDSVNDVSYWTYRSSESTGSGVQVAAVNVAVDVNGLDTDGGFTTLVFEPVYQTAQGSIQNDQWQFWDGGNDSIWWSSSPISGAPNRDTFVTLASIKAANPDAVVLGFGLNQGSGNPGIISGVDRLTFNGVTYDFENALNTGEITSPSEGEVVSGELVLSATYEDNTPGDNDGVQWALRAGTCASGTGTVAGNVDGFNTPYTWADSASFNATLDSTQFADGEYCFVFNPSDDAGENNVRLTREFTIDNPVVLGSKDECKNGGWATSEDPVFKNQGQCVSHFASNGVSTAARNKNR